LLIGGKDNLFYGDDCPNRNFGSQRFPEFLWEIFFKKKLFKKSKYLIKIIPSLIKPLPKFINCSKLNFLINYEREY